MSTPIAVPSSQKRRFNELAEEAAARVAGLSVEGEDDEDSELNDKPMMSVDEYRSVFSEDWQLSQFWYTTPFAMRFAEILHSLCTPHHLHRHTKPLKNARLLEEPTSLPAHLAEAVDIAVVDPPFLNEYTNTNVVKTLRQIMKPSAKTYRSNLDIGLGCSRKVVQFPSTRSVTPTKIEVLHGQLRNDFGCWASWEGSEELGAEVDNAKQ
ncbi:hypothetical protein R3P38DRAFT_3027363 [Favolaschia claudopus]|uniref:Uncharacterized protein n=1 Tax=Favolaschia claudopus TaxID=2862362 RepID=A0AAW0AI05_9AGAR